MHLDLSANRGGGARHSHRGLDHRAAAGRVGHAEPQRSRPIRRRPHLAAIVLSSTTWPARCSTNCRPELQTFLLSTSILNRLCGPLCDAVLDERPKTRTKDYLSFVRPSSSVLEELERANLFPHPAGRRAALVSLPSAVCRSAARAACVAACPPQLSPSSTGGRVSGLSSMGSPTRRFSMPWPPRISSARRRDRADRDADGAGWPVCDAGWLAGTAARRPV